MELRQGTITVRDKEYNVQELPAREYLKLKKRATDPRFGVLDEELYYAEVLKHIITSPKVTMDDFSMKELDEVAKAAVDFQLAD